MILRRSFGLSCWRAIELPWLFEVNTWDVGFYSTEVVFVENVGVLFFLCHDVEDFMFDISLDKVFQDIEVMFDDDCAAIF